MATRSTLMNYTKEQLIDRIECLEHNNAVLTETVDIQYRNAMKLFEDMNIYNEQHKKAKRCTLKSEVSE